ncbi:hypothetical protein [sulfur-oxidizing endosymbiont of Gigantopelta aegis]|uniref:hypothetical protein n=1 Tax=sulfur-oxidizing endosymbiont of Gigantopelta aegis TaxID=2794934 RepID=UPI0018DB2254|nr:hypothetical protein [sulfur-oxidizing endosymbiont of Gigantopelta aegis]
MGNEFCRFKGTTPIKNKASESFVNSMGFLQKMIREIGEPKGDNWRVSMQVIFLLQPDDTFINGNSLIIADKISNTGEILN